MTTEVCGILLHPSGHTLSPVLHRAAYAALKLDAVYLAFDIPPGQLRSAVESMRGLGLRQLSISLPHKEAVLELADEVSADAQQIGAANTLTRSANQLRADNTDWLAVRTRLGDVAVIRKSELVLLSRDEVRVNLHYIGDLDQLVLALEQLDLRLSQEGDEWFLRFAGRPGTGKS